MDVMSWRLTNLTGYVESKINMTVALITHIDWVLFKGRSNL